MTDADRPLTAPDAEALSAYLAGEMTAAEAGAFEARMGDEPALAAAADALASALATLHGADDATPPEGFADRLARRLEEERRAVPADLDAYRERRRSRSKVWMGVGTAAAVLAAGALMAGPVLRGLGGGGGAADTVAMDGAESAREEAAAGMDTGSAAAGSAPAGPVILDERVVIADEDALRRRYANLPEAAGVLGLSVRDARPVAQDYAAAVGSQMTVSKLEASAATDAGGETTDEDLGEGGSEAAMAPQTQGGAARGGAGDPCLAAISADARRPLVPVRVETLRFQGAEAIAYVLVTAEPGSRRLDRTEVWVVAPDCSTLVFQQH